MQRDDKIILGAVLLIFFSMVLFKFNFTGKVVNELPDLTGFVRFVDPETNEPLENGEVNLGDKSKILVTVKNIGGSTVPLASVSVKVVLKKDKVKVGNTRFVDFFNVLRSNHEISKEAIDAGAYTFDFNGPGEYCLELDIDSTKKIAELSEDNNEFNLKNNKAECIKIIDETTTIGEEEKKVEKKETKKIKKKKTKILPTSLRIQLLEPENSVLLTGQETNCRKENNVLNYCEVICELAEGKPESCSFSVDLDADHNYLLRGSTTTNQWIVEYVRIIDGSNRVFLQKSCTSALCELDTSKLLRPELRNEAIKPARYKIETNAKKKI